MRLEVSRVQHYSRAMKYAYDQQQDAEEELEHLKSIQDKKVVQFEQLNTKWYWCVRELAIVLCRPWKTTKLHKLKTWRSDLHDQIFSLRCEISELETQINQQHQSISAWHTVVDTNKKKDEIETNNDFTDRYNKANAFWLLSNLNTSADYSKYQTVDPEEEYNNPAGDKENNLN